MTQIFAILDTETDEFVRMRSGKVAWESTSAAKNAFSQQQGYDSNWKRLRFDEQTQYVIVNLSEYYFMYKGLCE